MYSPGTTYLQADYNLYLQVGQEGLIVYNEPHTVISLPNNKGATKGTYTAAITASAATFSLTFVFTDGYTATISFTAAGETATQIGDQLLTRLRAIPELSARVIGSNASGTLTFTSANFGVASGFVLTSTGAGTIAVTNTVAAANASNCPFGRIITSGTTDDTAGLISAAPSTSNIIRGITVRTDAGAESQGYGASFNPGYPPQAAMGVMTRGSIWVRTLTAVNPTSQVFGYHTGANAGRFRGSADGSDTTALTAAAGTVNTGWSFASVAAAGGLVKLRIGLP
jgi:hypothetical protein